MVKYGQQAEVLHHGKVEVQLERLYTRANVDCEAPGEDGTRRSVGGALDHARDDQCGSALDSCRDCRCRAGSSLFSLGSTCRFVWYLLSHYSVDHQVVATDLT